MPTPPKESIGGKATAFQVQSFEFSKTEYDYLNSLEDFVESDYFRKLDEFEQAQILSEIDTRSRAYEVLNSRVSKY